MSESDDIRIDFSFNSLKKKGVLIILILIILFGLYLRFYHVDYPVVGYHNWKETHYLTEARNFAENGFFEHGFFVPEFDYPDFGQDPSGVHSDSFPIISIFVGFFFILFGPSLFIARVIGILFSIGTIFMMYLLSNRLFKSESMALVVAFLTALSPLFVFFSHNVQLINPGIFFMVTSLYFFATWIKNDKSKYLYLTSLFFTLGVLTKYPFGIAAIPMLFMIPKERYKRIKKYSKQLLMSFLIFVPFILWIVYAEFVISRKVGSGAITGSLFDPMLIFSSVWFMSLKSYVADNYTFLGFYIAIFGVLLFLLFKRKNLGSRFLMGSFVGTIAFMFVMADKMQGHSYHQFPIAPFVIFFMAYAILMVSTNVPKFVVKGKNKKSLTIFMVLVICAFLISPSIAAKDRQFNTQFVGLDVAGEYVKEHAGPDDRIIHSGHQDYGFFWHADRKGIGDGIPDEKKIREVEDELGVNWIFVYQWGLSVVDQPQWEYISSHYSLRQVAFQVGANGQSNLVYLLLERGGSFDIDAINDYISGKEVLARGYEFTEGKIILNYVNIGG
ncbi:glycosyltransferase family 39 protein [archaeon]|nr:glycosyltransferase family 39 protein [archaeon]